MSQPGMSTTTQCFHSLLMGFLRDGASGSGTCIHTVEKRGDDNVLQPFHHTGQHDSVLGAWFCGPRDSWLVLHLKVEGGILRLLPPASWAKGYQCWCQHVAKITFHPGIVRYLWRITKEKSWLACFKMRYLS